MSCCITALIGVPGVLVGVVVGIIGVLIGALDVLELGLYIHLSHFVFRIVEFGSFIVKN